MQYKALIIVELQLESFHSDAICNRISRINTQACSVEIRIARVLVVFGECA